MAQALSRWSGALARRICENREADGDAEGRGRSIPIRSFRAKSRNAWHSARGFSTTLEANGWWLCVFYREADGQKLRSVVTLSPDTAHPPQATWSPSLMPSAAARPPASSSTAATGTPADTGTRE